MEEKMLGGDREGAAGWGLSSLSWQGSPHIKTRCSQAPEKWGALWIELWGLDGIFRICQAHPSWSQSVFTAGPRERSVGVRLTWARSTVFMCTLCEKQSGEWSPICEEEEIHGWEFWRRALCVWKPQWRPRLLKTTSLPGLASLWFVYIESYSRQHVHTPTCAALCTPREKYV